MRGQVRIIGGNWRGRKINVPDVPGVRPTPDRVRETLFNWLAPVLPGARCLDLFAGSGVLGFEALSRGAAYTVMVDQSLTVVKVLQAQLKILGVTNADVMQARIPHDWPSAAMPFDIVFLDPPYNKNLLLPTCMLLEEKKLLAPQALIYLESSHAIIEKILPTGWHILKSKKAGQVEYCLVEKSEE